MRKSMFLVGLVLVCLAQPLFAQCSESDKKALEAFDRAWGDASERGDRAALMAIYADDYLDTSLAGATSKTQTIDNAVRQAERNRANPAAVARVEHDYYIISCTQSSALITHRNVITRPNGTTFSTRSVHALEKRGGKWVVVSNAGHPLDDGAIVLFMEREWADAAVKNDAAWFERNFADDFTGISAENGALRNKREAIDFLKNMTVDAVDLSEMNVRVEGNTAVVTGVARVKGKDAKAAAFDVTARFSDVFVKRDGRWQALSTQETAVKK